MSNISTVYVVLKGNAIHSIHSSAESADVAKASVRGTRVSEFPLIKTTADGKTGVTEAFDLDAILGGGNSGAREFTARDNDVPDQPYRQPSGEYEDGEVDDDGDDSDVLVVDVPLAIRLMEWAHEEAADDNEIHEIVERMVTLTADTDSVLTMDHFEDIVGELADGEDLEGEGDFEQGPEDDDMGDGELTGDEMMGDDGDMPADPGYDTDEYGADDFGSLGGEDEEEDPTVPARTEGTMAPRRMYEGADMPLREYVEKLKIPDPVIPGVAKLFKEKTAKKPKGNIGQTHTVSVDPVTGAPKVDNELTK